LVLELRCTYFTAILERQVVPASETLADEPTFVERNVVRDVLVVRNITRNESPIVESIARIAEVCTFGKIQDAADSAESTAIVDVFRSHVTEP
jgi:hypothetical protein